MDILQGIAVPDKNVDMVSVKPFNRAVPSNIIIIG